VKDKERDVRAAASLVLLAMGILGTAVGQAQAATPVCVAGGPNTGTCVIDDFTTGRPP
jgi:hypothetical protein